MRRHLALALLATTASAQTLARPGWAGSGLTADRWWPHAVLAEAQPTSLPGSSETTLGRLRAHLEDLQTLGVDAILLQHLETGEAGAVPPIDSSYGTLDDFDALLNDAARHGMRIVVALRPGTHGDALVNHGRFWLGHGATGLALSGGSSPDDLRALRSALHSFVGDRILIADAPAPAADPVAGRLTPASRTIQPDLLNIRLPALSGDPAALRSALGQADASLSTRTAVPLLSTAPTTLEDPALATRALAAVLLGSPGAVLLPIDSLDLAHAADTAHPTLFAWIRQLTGLHRGNPILRSGTDTLLDHDADGALVRIRQGRTGAAAPIVAITNITGHPIRLSLVADVARLHLRGSFLRSLARSDGGMGAMPLCDVALPPFGVFVGELSR